MTASRTLFLASKNVAEVMFFKECARRLRAELVPLQSILELRDVPPSSVLLYSTDGDDLVGESRREWAALEPARVIAVGTHPTNRYPDILTEGTKLSGFFRHSLLRRYAPPSDEVYCKVLEAAYQGTGLGFGGYFFERTHDAVVQIARDAERAEALKWLQGFLKREKVDDRVIARAGAAVNELLMNALLAGVEDRREERRRVELAAQVAPAMVGVRVRDRCGTLEPRVALSHLNQDFRYISYKPSANPARAGLGLSGIVRAGLSLVIEIEPKRQTDMMLFFPNEKSLKKTRSLFQFTACFVTGEET
jgi:anti-sigma regulatory factor (Ser/Thr protein kinase)